jgi:hypothetical protein
VAAVGDRARRFPGRVRVRASALADWPGSARAGRAREVLVNALPVEPPFLRSAEARRVTEWRVDESAVALAGVSMGLRYPVRVKIATTRQDAGGYRGLDRSLSQHLVVISADQDAEAAGRAAWNALARAADRERRIGPRKTPAVLDAEARALESRNRVVPLVKDLAG